jgi:hypothetical protein
MPYKGTGMSSTVTSKTLASEGGPIQQAEYLKLFRADSIGEKASKCICLSRTDLTFISPRL